jgi:hypothetical protein
MFKLIHRPPSTFCRQRMYKLTQEAQGVADTVPPPHKKPTKKTAPRVATLLTWVAGGTAAVTRGPLEVSRPDSWPRRTVATWSAPPAPPPRTSRSRCSPTRSGSSGAGKVGGLTRRCYSTMVHWGLSMLLPQFLYIFANIVKFFTFNICIWVYVYLKVNLMKSILY